MMRGQKIGMLMDGLMVFLKVVLLGLVETVI